MRPFLPVLAIVCFLLDSAEARIGESEGQIQAHYGEAITTMPSQSGIGVTKCYSSNRFLISVTFLNGHSVREMIVKADKSKMADGEIQNFLEDSASSAAGHSPQMTGPSTIVAGVQQWRSIDQPARVAFYDSQTRALFITTQKFIDLTNATKRQTIVRSGTGLGAREQPHIGAKDFAKSNAMTIRRGQTAQPSSSPPAK